MKKTFFSILCLSLLLIVNRTYAQDILKAYIIKASGDTVKGSLQLERNLLGKNLFVKLGERVNFREENGGFKRYKPTDLLGFGYYPAGTNDVILYEAKKTGKNMTFLTVRRDGPLRLYRDVYLVEIGNRVVDKWDEYIGKKGQPILFIHPKFFEAKKRGPLKEYLSDCPVLAKDLADDNDFDIMAMVDKYNQWYAESHK